MRALRAPGRRHLRRERLLRASRPHPGQPHHPCGDRRVRHPGQALLHGRGALAAARLPRRPGGGGHGAAATRWRRTPTSARPDELITTTVDCSAVAERKYASLAAHASQSDNIFFLQMGEELFSHAHGHGELRAGAGPDRGAGPRGRPLRRAALMRPGLTGTGTRNVPSRACAPPGERDAGPARSGPYVAVPAGVVPARAWGTDPTSTERRRRRRRPRPVSRW